MNKPGGQGKCSSYYGPAAICTGGSAAVEGWEFYSRLKAPIFQNPVPRIERVVRSLVHGGLICQRQSDYLVGETKTRPRRFSLLPKVDKSQDKWPSPFMPPVRHIVSDCGSESCRVAEFNRFLFEPLIHQAFELH